MALEANQIKEKLQSPSKKNALTKAIQHENRLRFHTENYMDGADMAQPLTVFLEWVKQLIPKDKYNIFVRLFRLPTPNVQLINTIFEELERVFDGKDPVSSYQFTDSALRDDWGYYKKEHLNEPEIWRSTGWETMKSSINSVLVVDVPQEQTSERPEPYFYFLDIHKVIDYQLKQDGSMDWIIFKQPDKKIAAYDDTYYRIAQLNDKGDIGEYLVEEEHGLGHCPAAFFWTDALNDKHKGVKKSPISAELSNLDWLLFFGTSKRHLDLYAPYPIYSSYAADCDFANNETGEYCDGGFLRDAKNQYKVYGDGAVAPCPVCSDKRLAGVGSFIEVPVPATKDSPDLRNPVQITSVDKDSLQYNVDEVARLKNEIFTGVVGRGGDVDQKQSINEMQVTANFESKVSVLNNLKGNIEAAQRFVHDTICALRYGADYLGSSISLGTEFYIYTTSDLYAQYKQAKENGASEGELDAISDQIVTTEHKNNAMQQQRMLILKQLEPYRHYTRAEWMELHDKNLLDKILVQVKINFSNFIDRFERENTNIIEFGAQLEFDKKINIIKEELVNYANEQKNDSES